MTVKRHMIVMAGASVYQLLAAKPAIPSSLSNLALEHSSVFVMPRQIAPKIVRWVVEHTSGLFSSPLTLRKPSEDQVCRASSQ